MLFLWGLIPSYIVTITGTLSRGRRLQKWERVAECFGGGGIISLDVHSSENRIAVMRETGRISAKDYKICQMRQTPV
jgi:hypothetical protein